MDYKKEYLYKKILKAKQFLDDNYQDDINLGDLINAAFISKFHFIRLFKRAYKVTPHQYLKEKRLKQAKLELGTTQKTVSEICNGVGFNSVGSFCNLFKRTTAQTPLEYRNNFLAYQENWLNKPFENIPGCYTLVHHPKNSNFRQ